MVVKAKIMEKDRRHTFSEVRKRIKKSPLEKGMESV